MQSNITGADEEFEYKSRFLILMKISIAIQCRHPYSFGDKNICGPVIDFCINKITNPEQKFCHLKNFRYGACQW